MNAQPTSLPGVVVFEPRVFAEPRGWLLESWNAARYASAGLPREFAQDNVSFSVPGVLRGLHFQYPVAQGKLVSVLQGEIFDVAVDIRPDSPTYRRWVSAVLSSENHRQLWIPEGFAHGFVTRKASVVTYKVSTPYDPQGQRSVLWNDEELGIDWGDVSPMMSEKDAHAPRLRDYAPDELPHLET